jgi:putative hydrolase of the HAD superfamily
VAIKAVIFDCFGVLTRDGWLPFREKYFSDKPDLYEKATTSNHRVNAGLHSYKDFIHELANMAILTEAETRAAIEDNPPNEPLFTYIRDELKPRYKLGFLSNAGANWLDDIFQPWQVALFDEILLSYQIAATKPDPIMYETIAYRLGVMPEECVFIDDQARFCEGARAVGMQAIVYESTDQVTADLEMLLHHA